MNQETAEASISVMDEMMDKKEFATKYDLEKFGFETKSELRRLNDKMEAGFNRLDTKIDTSIANLESRMTIKLGSMLVAGIAIMTTLDQLF